MSRDPITLADLSPDQHLQPHALAGQLAVRCQSGLAPRFIAFWGHTPKRDDAVDKACLSQWFDAPFVDDDGRRYATAEHWMMAGKARVFADDATLARILAANSPAEAKALGREVQHFNDEVWKAACFDVVVAGNVLKFSQHPALGDFLRQTGQSVLVEASPRDRIWGIGLGPNNPDVEDPSRWRGRNLLGFALMAVRERLFPTG